MEQILEQLEVLNEKIEQIDKQEQVVEQKLLSVEETTEIVSLSETKIYELIKQEKIPYVMIGRRRMIPKKELSEWISQKSKGDNKLNVGKENMRIIG
ncbi:helix-turn-helix domain-containing protein [Sporohalobacter salinus]|uniref:helix-turn-helix domain-containing protein n=1 Tax=Sporohalobacter salinus TaxID=1494606 RepID=UPI001EF75C1F|nr:helix-turn-helix domain-containing protein [Sporohalobacter salinus]